MEFNETVAGQTINKTIHRDASFVEVQYYSDPKCKTKVMWNSSATNSSAPLRHYTERLEWHNSPINLPQQDVGPPYGVYCSGYAPVGQFKKGTCTMADVLAKRDGCIQLVNPLTQRYWFDTAYSSCAEPTECDGRKTAILAEANLVKDVIVETVDLLTWATASQAAGIAIAVCLHFVWETLMSGDVFANLGTKSVFALKNFLCILAFIFNVWVGLYLMNEKVADDMNAVDWLDKFMENECFDSEGTIILTKTREFINNTAGTIIIVGVIILVDSAIEDNISIVVEAVKEQEAKENQEIAISQLEKNDSFSDVKFNKARSVKI